MAAFLPILSGKAKLYDDVSVIVHESNEGEDSAFSGLKHEADIDLRGWDEFFAEVHISREKFSALLAEIEKGGATLQITVQTGKFEGFYATWSPSISEGRPIKFLNNISDVENRNEVPSEFLTRKKQNQKDSPVASQPIGIVVSRPLVSATSTTRKLRESLSAHDDEVHDNNGDAGNAPYNPRRMYEKDQSDQIAHVAAVTQQIRKSGLVIAGAIGVLTVATLFLN
ncbi:MAG: hypothetical protein R3D90_05665 [Paracoccaceae bacterium]